VLDPQRRATRWGSLSAPSGVVPAAIVEEDWQEVRVSFERFCLTTGIVTLAGMMEGMPPSCAVSAMALTTARMGTEGKGLHDGKVALERPRARARESGEIALPSWEAAMAEDWLAQQAMKSDMQRRAHLRPSADGSPPNNVVGPATEESGGYWLNTRALTRYLGIALHRSGQRRRVDSVGHPHKRAGLRRSVRRERSSRLAGRPRLLQAELRSDPNPGTPSRSTR
jgi:hypothetical protein